MKGRMKPAHLRVAALAVLAEKKATRTAKREAAAAAKAARPPAKEKRYWTDQEHIR